MSLGKVRSRGWKVRGWDLALVLVPVSVPALLLAMAAPSLKAADRRGASPPATPEASLALFQTHPDLHVECVVSEPLVVDPVAIDFGPDGRLWVVEMRDYPSGMDGNGKPGGRVKVLEDRDGDGHYDTATVFLDNLPFPTGLMVYGDGVLVCAAPDILYAVDTDADGVADRVDRWLTGFETGNFQARVNGLSLGLDNWVHGANGLLGGLLQGRFMDQPVDIRGRDFRFHPKRGRFEPESGLSQQGRVRTDWDDWIGSDNGTPGWHYPIPDRYFRRNPWVNAPAQRVMLSVGDAPNRVFPVSPLLERFNDPDHANQVTSGCGQDIYRDVALGPDFAGNFFLCEPVHNLVLRRTVHPEGGVLVGRRAPGEGQRDFLASGDHWFRPVQVRTGPDGALWVVDMVRYVIEHPRWIAPARLAELDVRAGEDRGRIYRVVPRDTGVGTVPVPVPVDVTRWTVEEAVRHLDTPRGAERDRIRQWLLHQAPSPEALAEARRRGVTGRHPEARVQLMSVLEAWDALDDSVVGQALGDPHPGVRRVALRWAETRWTDSPALLPPMIRLADDPVEEVRFQAALSLGSVLHPDASEALARIAIRDGDKPWFRVALLTARPDGMASWAVRVLELGGQRFLAEGSGAEWVEGWIRTATGARDGEGVRGIASALDRVAVLEADAADRAGEGDPGWPPWRIRAWGALEKAWDAMTSEGVEGPGTGPVMEFPGWKELLVQRDWATWTPEDQTRATAAVRALTHSPSLAVEDVRQMVQRLHGLDPAAGHAIEPAVLGMMSARNLPDAARWLLEGWDKAGPERRLRWMGVLLAREPWSRAVLDAVESGHVARIELAGGPIQGLRRQAQAGGWTDRLEAVLGLRGKPDRAVVVSRYEAVASQRGRSTEGHRLYQAHCAGCHAWGGEGVSLGPDLRLYRDKSLPDFLEAILDPDAVIEPRYVAYTVETTDGRMLVGVLEGETGTGFTLIQAGGLRETLPHAGVRSLQAMETSLMPEGFEEVLDLQGMADLITFLRQGHP